MGSGGQMGSGNEGSGGLPSLYLGVKWADCAREEWAPGFKRAKDSRTGQTLLPPVVPPAATGIPDPLLSLPNKRYCMSEGVGVTTKTEREEEDPLTPQSRVILAEVVYLHL